MRELLLLLTLRAPVLMQLQPLLLLLLANWSIELEDKSCTEKERKRGMRY